MSEIVVSGYSWDMYGTVYFYIGTGINKPSGTIVWLYQDVYSVGENEELVSVVVADVEGDGIAEIIVSGYYYDDSYDEWNGYQAVFSWSSTTGMILEYVYYGESGDDYAYSVITANVDDDAQAEVISCGVSQTHIYTGQINVQTASNYVPETGSIIGVVTDGVNPISSATVKVAVSRYSVVAMTTTLANGSSTLTDLPPASYDVEVYAAGKLNETQKGVLVKAGETTTVSFVLENEPVTSDHVVVADGFAFHVITVSNSTVTSFAFSKEQMQISFNVTGTSETSGFCNVTIPSNLLGGSFTVKVDGLNVVPDPVITSDGTHSFVYFTYAHSTRKIQIIRTTVIPEFHMIITLTLFITATLIAAILIKR